MRRIRGGKPVRFNPLGVDFPKSLDNTTMTVSWLIDYNIGTLPPIPTMSLNRIARKVDFICIATTTAAELVPVWPAGRQG